MYGRMLVALSPYDILHADALHCMVHSYLRRRAVPCVQPVPSFLAFFLPSDCCKICKSDAKLSQSSIREDNVSTRSVPVSRYCFTVCTKGYNDYLPVILLRYAATFHSGVNTLSDIKPCED